jgi:hypothetical protein
MNFSFIIKSIIISFFVFLIIYAVSFVSSQKAMLDSNNYGVKDTVKESIDMGYYRETGKIQFDQEQLLLSTIKNFLDNNNIKVDEVSFDIAIDEESDIVTVRIYTSKSIANSISKIDYTFSYQVVKR